MANKKVCNDMKKLSELVELVPQDRRPIAEKLVEELTFMAKTLGELKAAIEEHGAVDLFKQGSQEFLRENPALKSYSTVIQRYSLLYKQFTDLLPKQAADTTGSEFFEFVKQG